MSRQRTASGPTLLVIAALVIAASLVGAAQVLGGGARGSSALSPASVAAVQAPPAIPSPAPSSIAVVRREGGHDALWSVASADGVAVKLSDLSFRPARIEASPNGTKLAVLRSAGGPRVAVYDVTVGTLRFLSLAPRGVKQVSAIAWLSNSRLLVSGSRTAAGAYAMDDRLYTVNVATSRSSWFRSLRGTEPSVAAGGSRLVYVRLSDGGRSPVVGAPRRVIEKLLTVKLGSAGTPQVIAGDRYSSGLDIRAFRDPRVSPDGSSVISSTTGSDVAVTYTVRAVATGKRLFSRKTQLSGHAATAWDSQGSRVAFWGMPSLASSALTRIYVFDLVANKLTGVGRYADRIATGLSWAPDGSRLAYTLSAFGRGVDQGRLWIVDPGTPATAQVLGSGGLPAWLP